MRVDEVEVEMALNVEAEVVDVDAGVEVLVEVEVKKQHLGRRWRLSYHHLIPSPPSPLAIPRCRLYKENNHSDKNNNNKLQQQQQQQHNMTGHILSQYTRKNTITTNDIMTHTLCQDTCSLSITSML
ncbi:hypothetical protein Pcinc_028413 [Petrolisthes cinctipes]|uniref:Uncharacterized protein n=1 Tax=Petrolisthes cinctipes TaxID=88211 RepID=A0AAE1F331_PETCI|nr:hypothetical protein Pcinc_028413 [Petrolisthes cinctipes]